MVSFIHDVIAERQRQAVAKGFSAMHDKKYHNGEQARAGAAYAGYATRPLHSVPCAWLQDYAAFKHYGKRRSLIAAEALSLAETERIDRATLSQNVRPPGYKPAGINIHIILKRTGEL